MGLHQWNLYQKQYVTVAKVISMHEVIIKEERDNT